MSLIYPRRFGEVWQMSADWFGTTTQQEAVRAALSPEFGTAFHRVTQKIDRKVNQSGRSYLTVAFAPLPGWLLGHAGATGILLSELLTDLAIISAIVRHEMGHVYDQLDLLTQDDKFWFMDRISDHHDGNWMAEYQETWADAFRDWIVDPDGVWASLTPLLAP